EHAAFAGQPLADPLPAIAAIRAEPQPAADRPDADRVIARHRRILLPENLSFHRCPSPRPSSRLRGKGERLRGLSFVLDSLARPIGYVPSPRRRGEGQG